MWLGLITLCVVFVSTAMAGYKVRLFVLTDPQFILSRDHKDALTIQGMNYTSRAKVSRRISATAFSPFPWRNGVAASWPSIGWRTRPFRESGRTAW